MLEIMSLRRLTWPVVLIALAGAGTGCKRNRGLDDETEKWLRRLKKSDREERENAIRILSQRKGQELHVVPALIEAVDDRDPIVAKSASEALKGMLAKPDMPDQRTAWEEYWRREKKRFEEDKKRSPEERMKLEKAALESDRGFLHMARGQFKVAEGFFLEAVALAPDEPKYWNNLGKCRMNMGMLPDAVDSFRKALERDSSYVPGHFNLGEAFLQISRVTGNDRTYEALGHADAVVRLDRESRNWAGPWLRARILFHMAMSESQPQQRQVMYGKAWESIRQAILIVELSRNAPETAEVRKTAALIAYGMELYYRSYKELTRVYDLGYDMDPDFVAKLEESLRREAHRTGAEPPKMPTRPSDDTRKGPPPALRLPFGNEPE